MSLKLPPQTAALVHCAVDLPSLFRTCDNTLISPLKDVDSFISAELDVSRLNYMVDRGLWLAGRIGNIRPLHRQRLLGRRIVITEQLDLHLLWRGDVIFIKPLPVWLLDEQFVKAHVSLNHEADGAANGFLSSYARLINYKSDFQIAKDERLVPEGMTWQDWKALAEKLAILVEEVGAGKRACARRFEFGELRLIRVNMIYRFHLAYRFKHVFRGYHHDNSTYESFLRRNFAWLIAVFVYLTVILTAMQVGLGTSQLRDDRAFNNASYGFTVFAILLPLMALGVGVLFSLILTVYYVQATRKHLKGIHAKAQPVKQPNV